MKSNFDTKHRSHPFQCDILVMSEARRSVTSLRLKVDAPTSCSCSRVVEPHLHTKAVTTSQTICTLGLNEGYFCFSHVASALRPRYGACWTDFAVLRCFFLCVFGSLVVHISLLLLLVFNSLMKEWMHACHSVVSMVVFIFWKLLTLLTFMSSYSFHENLSHLCHQHNACLRTIW